MEEDRSRSPPSRRLPVHHAFAFPARRVGKMPADIGRPPPPVGSRPPPPVWPAHAASAPPPPPVWPAEFAPPPPPVPTEHAAPPQEEPGKGHAAPPQGGPGKGHAPPPQEGPWKGRPPPFKAPPPCMVEFDVVNNLRQATYLLSTDDLCRLNAEMSEEISLRVSYAREDGLLKF